MQAKRINKPAFIWHPPSDKQKEILYWWTPESPNHDKSYFEAEGSVRCGKTVLATFSYVNWASFNFDREEFALCSKTIGTCIRNVVMPLRKALSVEPNYNADFKRGREEGPHIVITNLDSGSENIFWVFGGKDESSQDLIQGKTLAGILFDEAPLMPQSFINQGLARLSVEGAKAWFLNNPETPTHKLYVETIDPLQEAGKLHYLHITMDDNPALSDEAKNRIKSQWPVGSVLYRRYVLGERAAAEGRVFPFFDEQPSAGYVVESVPDHFTEYLVGLDYGISNPFVAVLWGLSGGIWYILKEFNWDSAKEKKQKSNPDYIEDLARLITRNGKPVFPRKILIPPEENGFIRDLKRAGQTRPNICGVDAADNKIMPGIEDLTTLFSLGRLKILHTCPATIHGFNNLLWDAKKQQQGSDMYVKGGSGAPDHACDANRYTCRPAAKTLRQMGLIL